MAVARIACLAYTSAHAKLYIDRAACVFHTLTRCYHMSCYAFDIVVLAQTFQVKCNDNADVATQMFDALRAEMQRIDKLQKDLRKDKRTLTQGQRDRDYWKKPLDHGQVNRTT